MKKILINSVFVGDYGYNQKNLPHEVINFFRADNGNFYIYITPYGVLNNELKDICDLEAVLFVRRVGNGLVEILAKAEIGENSVNYTKDIKSSQTVTSSIREIKDTKAKENYENATKDITYGGISIKDIHNQDANKNDIYVTLKVDSISLPLKTIYLTNNDSNKKLRNNVCVLPSNKNIISQSMKSYFDDTKDSEAYNTLQEIIKDNDLWRSPEETLMYESVDSNSLNFFKITRQQDNEVMFSNMFYYLFNEYPDLVYKFSKEVLGVEIDLNTAKIEREKDHMDIRIIDSKNYIIIENKIKSLINGLSKDENGEFKKDATNNKYISQLSNYYEEAKKQCSNEDMTISGFIFTPDYNPIDKDKYLNGDKYTIIKYSDLYKFFNEYNEYIKSKDNGVTDIYFNDCIAAMKKHTEETDNEYRNELMHRLDYRIKLEKSKIPH